MFKGINYSNPSGEDFKSAIKLNQQSLIELAKLIEKESFNEEKGVWEATYPFKTYKLWLLITETFTRRKNETNKNFNV